MPKFKGFNTDQKYALLLGMGYKGPKSDREMEDFIQSSPSISAKMARNTANAEKRISEKNFAQGGLVQKPNKSLQDFVKKSPGGKAIITAADPNRVAQQTKTEKIQDHKDNYINQDVGKQEKPDKVEKPDPVVAEQVQTPDDFEVSKVDPTLTQDKVKDVTDDLEAATAEPSKKATVQGQLEGLMKDFEDGTPPWASGAMRSAMSTMQSRGLGASSMAGQAVVQAAMEAALPIASQDAQTQAQFEMQNLTNEQQTTLFKSQQLISSLFTDQAQENAAKQFNAASENQTKEFFAGLEATVSQFNASQVNAIKQFNSNQDVAIEQFNSQIDAQRDQFNAKNSLIVAQANAQWRQTMTTANTQMQNEANMEYARAANSLTSQALDQIWQKERDEMAFAFAQAESEKDRQLQLLIGSKNRNLQRSQTNKQALGYITGKVLGGIF